MSDIIWLNENSYDFPPVSRALREPDGLLAAGGDLAVERLLEAYRRGIFPWYEEDQPVLWWSPDPRCVLKPDQLHVSRSLKKALRKNIFTVSYDDQFQAVIQACAESRQNQDGTWITPDMLEAFLRLHSLGVAHSVEVWADSELVGGLYGIAMGRVFFGESMFSRRTDASKVALYHLNQQLLKWGFNLVDCQVHSEHLKSLGAEIIPRSQFIAHLEQNISDTLQSLWNCPP